MKKTSKSRKRTSRATQMRGEYNFSRGVRGKYAKRYAQGTNLVLLEPDVAAEFRTAAAGNNALRALLRARSSPQ